MGRIESIDNGIWADPDFADLTPNAKLVYLWSWTNPHCGMAGLYKIARRLVAFGVGLPETDVDRAASELADVRMLYYERDVIWVRSRVHHLKTRTQQMARSVAKDVARIAENHPLRIEFMEMYGGVAWLADQLKVLVPPDQIPSSYVSPGVRQRVLERDGFACVDCGKTRNLTMDHVVPRSHGGHATFENLATRCRSCNSRKGVRPSEHGGIREPQEAQGPLVVQDSSDIQEPHEAPKSRSESEPVSNSTSDSSRASGRVDQLVPPRELAAQHPAVAARLDETLAILVAVHAERGGQVPTPRGVGLAMLRHPERDHVAVAYDLQHWALAGRGQNQQVKDWARTYATFLDRAPAATPTRAGQPRASDLTHSGDLSRFDRSAA